MVSKVGTSLFSLMTWTVGVSSCNFFTISVNSDISLSWTVSRIKVISAFWAESQTAARAILYDHMRILYALRRMSLDSDPIWSSKMSIAVCTAVTNVWVLFGCFARTLIFGADIVRLQLHSSQICHCIDLIFTAIYKRIHCFDLRTQWYSYQSNRLINRLM